MTLQKVYAVAFLVLLGGGGLSAVTFTVTNTGSLMLRIFSEVDGARLANRKITQ